MTTTYTCGHEATFDDDEYANGSYALWKRWSFEEGDFVGECYGVLCNECIPLYEAVKCKLGGEL